MFQRQSKIHFQAGLTLVETLITTALFALITLGATSFIRSSYEAQRFALEDARSVNEARRGLKTMLAELREARHGEDGSYILEQVDDQEIIFFGDVDKDGGVERVHYFLSGTNLQRGIINPQDIGQTYPENLEELVTISKFVRNGAASIFTYYNGDWPGDVVNNPLPTPARLTDTKMLRVRLDINEDPLRAPVAFTLEGAVQIRNLKTNL